MKSISKLSLNVITVFLVILMVVQSVPVTAFEGIIESSDMSESSIDTIESEPYIEYEDVTLRDEYTKHFRMSNGTNLAVRYNRPVHTLEDGGEWADIDLSCKYNYNEIDGKGNYTCDVCNIDAKISDSVSGNLFELFNNDSNYKISFTLNPDALNDITAEVVDNNSKKIADETTAEKNLRIIENPLHTSNLRFKNAYEGVDII